MLGASFSDKEIPQVLREQYKFYNVLELLRLTVHNAHLELVSPISG